ncbi:MAG TPA: SMI1/KNR4 family protein [Herpetosiphonaceae bacterium]
MQEPTCPDDLIPPFGQIGEPGWDDALRALLSAYGCPPPQPTRAGALSEAEARLGMVFPASVRQLYEAFGPLDFDGLVLLDPGVMIPAAELWMWEMLGRSDQRRLAGAIAIAEIDSGDAYALDPATGACCRVSHDPAAIEHWLPSFDALIQCAVIDLSWSYYGWPGPEIPAWASQLMMGRYGIRWL